VGNADETRKQIEEDAKEDLELEDEDADKIAGGTMADKTSPLLTVIQKI
jgi:hypothetical protein